MHNDIAVMVNPKYEILKWGEFRGQKPMGSKWSPIAEF